MICTGTDQRFAENWKYLARKLMKLAPSRQCAIYNVHCTVCSVQFSVYTVQCAFCSAHCAGCSL